MAALNAEALKRLLADAERALTGGRLPEAIEALRNLTALDPSNAVAFAMLGNAQQQQGDTLLARTSLERAVALRPRFFEALAQLGMIHVRLGQWAEAERAFRDSVAAAPNHADIRVNLANLLRQQRRFADAEAEYRRAIELAPEAPMAPYLLGTLLAELGRRDEAKALLDRSTRSAPRALEPWLALGHLAADAGDHAAAESHFHRATDIERKSEEAWIGYIRALFGEGKLDQAEQALADALVAGIRTASILAMRASVQRQRGRHDEARAGLQEALRIDPQNLEAQGEVAALYLDQGNNEGAVRILEGLAAQYPKNAWIRENLEIAHQRSGKYR